MFNIQSFYFFGFFWNFRNINFCCPRTFIVEEEVTFIIKVKLNLK